MDSLFSHSPDLAYNPLADEEVHSTSKTRELGSNALEGESWGRFYEDHPELQELDDSERLQFRIDALEDAAQRFEATNIEVADALRKEVSRLLLEKAEPFAKEIIRLKLTLTDRELSKEEMSAIKDEISNLELKYHQMMQYDPYPSGMTPYTREQLRRQFNEIGNY